ncbi:MAG TPA: hypothetical protein DHU81_15185 [Hyphomonas sp.]|nr:hypothetical protein [Hyphomonas sp.]
MAILDPLKKNQYTTTGMPATTQASQGTASARPTGGGVSQGTAQTYNAATGTAQTYKPVERDVKANETVQSQLGDILGQNSVYMQRARESANQQMNSRGLYSSSMAVGAPQGAAIDRALPIAQQDASTYAQRASQNLGAVNDAGQFNANSQNTMTLNNLQAQNRAAEVNAGNIQQMTMTNMDAQNQSTLLGRQLSSQEKMQSQQINSQEKLQGLQIQSQERQQQLQMNQDLVMRRLNEQQQVGMLRLEQQYGQIAQKSEVVSRNYAQMMDSLAQIGSNNSLTPDQQRAGAQLLMDQMNNFQSFANDLYRPTNSPVYQRTGG